MTIAELIAEIKKPCTKNVFVPVLFKTDAIFIIVKKSDFVGALEGYRSTDPSPFKIKCRNWISGGDTDLFLV